MISSSAATPHRTCPPTRKLYPSKFAPRATNVFARFITQRQSHTPVIVKLCESPGRAGGLPMKFHVLLSHSGNGRKTLAFRRRLQYAPKAQAADIPREQSAVLPFATQQPPSEARGSWRAAESNSFDEAWLARQSYRL